MTSRYKTQRKKLEEERRRANKIKETANTGESYKQETRLLANNKMIVSEYHNTVYDQSWFFLEYLNYPWPLSERRALIGPFKWRKMLYIY